MSSPQPKFWFRIARFAAAMLALAAVIAVARFRRASKDSEITTAFAEVVALRRTLGGSRTGEIRLPASESIWNSKQPYARAFAKALNGLPPGEYRFTVVSGRGRDDFTISGPTGNVIASGIVPVDPLCDP